MKEINNNIMNIESSLEFLTSFPVFEKNSAIRRVSDLNTKVADSSANLVLPKDVMLHMMDNISHSDQSTDTFNLENYPFLNAKNNLKYLYNFTDFDALRKEELNKFTHRLLRPKLNEILRAYGMANRKIMIPALKLDSVLKNKNCVIVVNYNPLYRIISTNARPINQYYRYQAFISAALRNTRNFDRLHMLVIPVPDIFEYNRSNIIGIIQAGEVSSPRLLSDSHFYFFIIDLIALLLDNNSKLSSFNCIDKRDLSKINIMLTHKEKSIIFNIGKLASLAKNKTYVFNFVNNISRISGANVPVEILSDDESKNVLVDDVTETPIIDKPIAQVNPVLVKSLSPKSVLNTPILPDKKEAQLVEKDAPRINTQGTDIKPEILDENKPIIEPIADTIENRINQDQPLSQKQLTRIEVLSNKYKTIVVKTPDGMRTIDSILSEPVDINVQKQTIPVKHADHIDPSMLNSATRVIDKGYRDKLLRKDIVGAVVAFKDNGLFLTDYTEKNEYNSFTRVKHIRAVFHDIKGKRHTVNFKIPMPDDDGYYLVNGVKLSMSKQWVNIPICKISPTRVSLISNFNKTLVDKVQSVRHSLPEVIANKAKELNLKVIPKLNTYIGIKAPYDYKQLGGKFSKITTPENLFFFEYKDRLTFFDEYIQIKARIRPFAAYENQFGVMIGCNLKEPSHVIFMSMKNLCTKVDIQSGNIIERDIPITAYLGNLNVPAEWCNLKILDKNIPIVFILGYRYGISSLLKNLNVKHRFVPKADKRAYNQKETEILIKFADGVLIFDRYPLLQSYIMAGLVHFKSLSEMNFIDLDGKDAYYQLLTDKGMSINYLRGIDAWFNFFIDKPITYDILVEMGEPTNTRDLLIRAVDMLVNSTDKAPSSITNFRLRSAEKIPAMIYNEIARQYANYINSNFKDLSFSINTEAIFQRILQDETMNLREDINPIHSIKEISRSTYTGFGGRSSEAFVARDRKYPDDAVGVLGTDTTDSGSVGMVASLSADPKIKNLRGMIDDSADDLTVTNILSDTALLMPGVINDD